MFAALKLVPARNRAEERKGKTKTMTNDKLWELVRVYNNLSHVYSQIADDLTRLAQEVEEERERQ